MNENCTALIESIVLTILGAGTFLYINTNKECVHKCIQGIII